MITSKYPLVEFSEILQRVHRTTEVENDKNYRSIGISLYGDGIFVKESRSGMEIAAKKQEEIIDGDVVYSKLFAWRGAFAVAKNSTGCIASSEFPIYKHDEKMVDIRYLEYFFKSENIATQAKLLSKGSTALSRFRLNPDNFMKLRIPLPSLKIQESIVSFLDETFSRAKQALKLHSLASNQVRNLLITISDRFFNEDKPNGKVIKIERSDLIINQETRNPAKVNPSGIFKYLEISDVEGETGRILRVNEIIGRDAPSRARRVMKTENVLFSTVRPYLRGFTIVPAKLNDQICSTGFAVFSCPETIKPEFLLLQFFSNFFIKQCVNKMRGAHYPAINLKQLKECKIIIPSLQIQVRLVEYLQNLEKIIRELKDSQKETSEYLATLNPSLLNDAFMGKLEV